LLSKYYRAVKLPETRGSVPANIEDLIEYVVLGITEHGGHPPGVEVIDLLLALSQGEAGEIRDNIFGETTECFRYRTRVSRHGPVNAIAIIIVFEPPDGLKVFQLA
jgi:hypothetical protein